MLDIYTAVLTGSADSIVDFSFMVKSYSGIHYSGAISYMTMQLPKVDGYIEAIADRPNGTLKLKKNGLDLFSGIITDINQHTGPTSKTISVSANYLTTETGPVSMDLPVTKVDFEYDGNRIFTIAGHHAFKATDSLLYDSETIVIDKVEILLNNNNKYMRLREL